jgi:hypothetical protein
MADPSPNSKLRQPEPSRADSDRFPSNAELLHELRKHGAKPPRRETPTVGRRTRDYLLTAGIGSLVIGLGTFRLLGASDPGNALKLALTGIAVFCGLLWFIFYGVMSRY